MPSTAARTRKQRCGLLEPSGITEARSGRRCRTVRELDGRTPWVMYRDASCATKSTVASIVIRRRTSSLATPPSDDEPATPTNVPFRRRLTGGGARNPQTAVRSTGIVPRRCDRKLRRPVGAEVSRDARSRPRSVNGDGYRLRLGLAERSVRYWCAR